MWAGTRYPDGGRAPGGAGRARLPRGAPGRVDRNESPILKARQEQALAGCGVPVAWRRSLSELPGEGGPLLVLGNEFLDALPIRQYVRANGAWHERLSGSMVTG